MDARSFVTVLHLDLSNPKPGHTTGGSGQRRTAGRLGGAGPAGLFAQDTNVPRALEGIEDNCLERLFESTNKGIPI